MAKETGAGRSGLSPSARPFTIDRSSSVKADFHEAAASRSLSGHDLGTYEYGPFPSDGSLWNDYAFDYSFLSFDDHTSIGEDLFSYKDKDMMIDPQGEADAVSSKLCGHLDHATKSKSITIDFEIMEQTNAESVSDSSKLSLSDVSAASRPGDSQKQLSVALPEIATSHFDSDVTLEERISAHVTPTSVLGNSGVSSLVNSDSSGSASGIRACGAKETFAYFDKKLADPSGDGNNENPIANKVLGPLVSFKPKLRVVCPGDNKSDLHGADASVSEKYSIPSDQDDSDVDSPCWKGIRSYKSSGGTLKVSLSASEVISAIPEVETPVAQVAVASSEVISDTPEVGIPVAQVGVASSEVAVSALALVTRSHLTSIEGSNNHLNGRHGLNPLAAHFIPANARQNIEIPGKECEWVGSTALQETGFSTVALSSGSYCYPTKAPEVPLATKVDFSNHISTEFQEPTLPSMTNNMDTNVGLASKVSSSKAVSLYQSGNDFRISKRLNPTARQFVPFNAKQTASDHEKEVGGGNLVGIQTITSSTASLTEGNLQPSALVIQPSDGVHVQETERVLANKACRSSKLKTSFTERPVLLDNHFMSNSRLLPKPSASSSVKDTASSQTSLSENATASSAWRVEALSDMSHQVQNCPSQSLPAKLDVKKLLLTMHELSELLIHVHECSIDHALVNEQEHALAENIMKNLNLYVGNSERKYRSSDSSLRHASFKSEQKVNASKLSIRDLQIKKENETTVEHDLEMKNCSLVLNEKGSPSGFQDNYSTGEEMNPQALFYRSLWLKAEAARCSAEFEACLSNIKKW